MAVQKPVKKFKTQEDLQKHLQTIADALSTDEEKLEILKMGGVWAFVLLKLTTFFGELIMKAQVLYNLRECTGFVSGAELHGIFQELIGDPSPSGHVDLPSPPKEIKAEMLTTISYSVVENWDGLWNESWSLLTVEEATEQSLASGGIVVPSEAAKLMQGQKCDEYVFDCGFLCSPGDVVNFNVSGLDEFSVEESGLNIPEQVWNKLTTVPRQTLLDNFSPEDRIDDAYTENGVFHVAVSMGNVGSGIVEWTRKLY